MPSKADARKESTSILRAVDRKRPARVNDFLAESIATGSVVDQEDCIWRFWFRGVARVGRCRLTLELLAQWHCCPEKMR